jgi:hypothetical protein
MEQARASALRWGRMSRKDGATGQRHLDRVLRNVDQADAILTMLRTVLNQKDALPRKVTLTPPLARNLVLNKVPTADQALHTPPSTPSPTPLTNEEFDDLLVA